MDKKYLRSLIFRHLDGLVTAPVLSALASKGVLHYIVEHKSMMIEELTKEFQSNEGYLNVALRVLASQNMLEYSVNNESNTVEIQTNKYSDRAFTNIDIYQDLATFLAENEVLKQHDFSDEFCKKWVKLFDKYKTYLMTAEDEEFLEKPLHYQITKHIEGVLVGPIIVRMGMSGLFHKYFMEASFNPDEFHKNPQAFEKVLERLAELGWFTKQEKNYKFMHKPVFSDR